MASSVVWLTLQMSFARTCLHKFIAKRGESPSQKGTFRLKKCETQLVSMRGKTATQFFPPAIYIYMCSILYNLSLFLFLAEPFFLDALWREGMVPEKTCTPRLCTHEHTNMIALTLRRYREKKKSASFQSFFVSILPFSDTTLTCVRPNPFCPPHAYTISSYFFIQHVCRCSSMSGFALCTCSGDGSWPRQF